MACLRRLRYPLLLTTVALSAAYFAGGLAPKVPAPVEHVSDVTLHAVAYAILAGMAAATVAAFGAPGRAAVVSGLLYALAHGASLEVLQYFAPPRQAEVKDLSADLFGAVLGITPWWAAWRGR